MKEGWKYKRLGEICDFQGGSQPPKSEWTDSLLDGYVRMLQIRDFTQSRKVSPEYVKSSKKLRFCKSDDILLGRYGASVGKVLTGLEGAYNVAIMKTIPNESVISKRYIKRYFESDLFQDILKRVCGIRAAQAGFSKEDIENELVPVPSLAEQQQIVSFLDSEFEKIDALKANAETQLQAAKDLFQAALKELLTPKEGWEEKKLGEVITNLRTGLNPRTHFKLNTPDATYNYITVRELKGFDIVADEKTDKVNAEALNRINKRSNLLKGDVLFSGTGTIGNTALVTTLPETWNIKEGIYALTPNHKMINSKFLIYVISSDFFLNNARKKAEGTGVKSIPMKRFVELAIYIPNMFCQEKCVAKLDALSANVKALQTNYTETITLCNDLKQALLKKVFG